MIGWIEGGKGRVAWCEGGAISGVNEGVGGDLEGRELLADLPVGFEVMRMGGGRRTQCESFRLLAGKSERESTLDNLVPRPEWDLHEQKCVGRGGSSPHFVVYRLYN
jgi:hypothetical protein